MKPILIGLVLLSAPAYADVDLFPKKALQTATTPSNAQTDTLPERPMDRSSDDSRATSNEPRLLYAQREQQVDLAQAAYEEPATWERIDVEVSVDASGKVDNVGPLQPRVRTRVTLVDLIPTSRPENQSTRVGSVVRGDSDCTSRGSSTSTPSDYARSTRS